VMQALKTVTERYYPRIKITVHESSGTTDSLNRLESRQAQMAAAQADVVPGPSARTVAVLFEDAFQLLVHKDVPVTQFVDLKGRRIALARSGGQYRSFQFLAQHYGLKESDMTFVGGDDEGAELAFARNEADAIFRVRPLHDAAIAHTVSGGAANFVPITDISALSADMPAYTASSIPKGAYAANPIIPPSDIPTVSVQRLLVARRDVENEVVYAILRILMERHDELAAAIPNDRPEIRSLIAHISRPVAGVGLNAGLHPGATAYYDRESTSFVRSHADLLALLLAGFVFAFMWFSQLGQLTAWRQKRRADQYNRQVLALLRESRLGKRERSMEQIRSDLTTLLLAAVQDLERDRLSEESFHSFHRIWQIAHDMIGLDARTPRPKSDVVTEVPEPSPSSWGLVRFFKREA
jgi:uncharacterized protein